MISSFHYTWRKKKSCIPNSNSHLIHHTALMFNVQMNTSTRCTHLNTYWKASHSSHSKHLRLFLHRQPPFTPSPFTLFLSLVCFLRCRHNHRHNHRRTTKEINDVTMIIWINISEVKLNNSLLHCFHLRTMTSSNLKFVIIKMYIFIVVGLVLLLLLLLLQLFHGCLSPQKMSLKVVKEV